MRATKVVESATYTLLPLGMAVLGLAELQKQKTQGGHGYLRRRLRSAGYRCTLSNYELGGGVLVVG